VIAFLERFVAGLVLLVRRAFGAVTIFLVGGLFVSG
jgi:hypothetical protein